METIGARLKREREAAGLIQEQLAVKAGVSQGTVGNIESGTRGYGKSVLKIAKVLDLHPGYLQCETDERTGYASYPNNASMVPHVAEPTRGVRAAPQQIIWPFDYHSYGRLTALQRSLGAKRYGEAIKELDSLLDIVLTKWEREAAEKRKRQAA